MYLRFKKKGAIRNFSSDAPYLKKNILSCIKRLRKKYDPKTSPPEIKKRIDPYNLVSNEECFKIITHNPKKFEALKDMVFKIWKMDKTNKHSDYYTEEIHKTLYENKYWTPKEAREYLNNFFTKTHPDWVQCWT